MPPTCGHCEVARRHGGVALLSAPLRYHDHVIGLLDTYNCQKYELRTQMASRRCSGPGRPGSEAIHNADILRQNQALMEINRLLAGPFNPSGILDLILARGLELVNADAGCIYLKDFEAKKLIHETSYGVVADDVPMQLDYGDSIIGEVGDSGAAKVIDDLRDLPTAVVSACVRLANTELRSQVAVPCGAKSRTIGVLVGGSRFSTLSPMEI